MILACTTSNFFALALLAAIAAGVVILGLARNGVFHRRILAATVGWALVLAAPTALAALVQEGIF